MNFYELHNYIFEFLNTKVKQKNKNNYQRKIMLEVLTEYVMYLLRNNNPVFRMHLLILISD